MVIIHDLNSLTKSQHLAGFLLFIMKLYSFMAVVNGILVAGTGFAQFSRY